MGRREQGRQEVRKCRRERGEPRKLLSLLLQATGLPLAQLLNRPPRSATMSSSANEQDNKKPHLPTRPGALAGRC